jgi:hypothetical protein
VDETRYNPQDWTQRLPSVAGGETGGALARTESVRAESVVGRAGSSTRAPERTASRVDATQRLVGQLHDERNALQRAQRLGQITAAQLSRLEDILAEIDWLDRQRISRGDQDPGVAKLDEITARLVALSVKVPPRP